MDSKRLNRLTAIVLMAVASLGILWITIGVFVIYVSAGNSNLFEVIMLIPQSVGLLLVLLICGIYMLKKAKWTYVVSVLIAGYYSLLIFLRIASWVYIVIVGLCSVLVIVNSLVRWVKPKP